MDRGLWARFRSAAERLRTSIARGVIHAALTLAGYSDAQADARIEALLKDAAAERAIGAEVLAEAMDQHALFDHDAEDDSGCGAHCAEHILARLTQERSGQ